MEDKKYELTENTIEQNGRTLYQIRRKFISRG